jgi:hypothetical protein
MLRGEISNTPLPPGISADVFWGKYEKGREVGLNCVQRGNGKLKFSGQLDPKGKKG